ncbi:MAG TPA: carboxypeptidase-like regulatory domain-containing protein, partial [Bacteroidales bacterium]|nr:carboxypeptidase-like regulatory domain-containing protein [Bacteroidales bacterium]
MKKRCLSWVLFALLLMGSQVMYAQIQIEGSVKNPEGDPLPGVNIVEKGTNRGTTTDMEGYFTFTVSGEDATLVFSFVGMQTLEKKVGDQRTFDVVLQPASSELEEVVVVGYGTQQ